MSVNLFTLSVIKETTYAMKLYKTLGSYIFDYILSDNHNVEDNLEDKTIDLLQECNEYADKKNMPELCSIYDVFGLEQDAMIIYHIIANYLIEEKQQIQEIEITIRKKGN